MGAPEDVAQYGLRISLGSILDNYGFATITDDSLDILSDLMKRFINNLSAKSKILAEHAGRNDVSTTDLNLAFKRIRFCTTEFSNFLAHNTSIAAKPLPKFPVPKQQVRPLYHPQPSERELEARPEYIPAFLQAAHPEWTRDGADYLAVMKPSTSGEKKGSAPDFPSFATFNSHTLGIGKDDRRPPPLIITRTDDSSATGIKSSANIASQKLYNPDYAAQLIKKKNRPFNGLKDSRSNTPISRPYSPYEEERASSRTDSPSTSRSAEKIKFKPRPPSSASRFNESARNEPSTSVSTSEILAGMPKLEMIGAESKISNEGGDMNESMDRLEPTEDLVNQNILLFQQLKQQQEKLDQEKRSKENEKIEKQRKKDEQKEKRKEETRRNKELKKEENNQKKMAREEEKRKKKEEKKQVQQQKQEQETKTVLDRDVQQKLTFLLESEKTPEKKAAFEEQKPLKLVITNPKSSSASSAFSPSPIRAPPSIREITPPPVIVPIIDQDDEDTIPYYGATDLGDTTFSFNTSTDETPKKKKKKKDKDRDRSPTSHKKHKKDKEHKKKKKEKREREERERQEGTWEQKREAEQKPLTLKIKLGDHPPSAAEGTPGPIEPVKFKFKLSMPPGEKREEEKVAPLRLPLIRTPVSSEKKHRSDKSQHITPEKEEKMRKKEEKRRKEREEAEQRQRAEYERIQKEHEEKQKREAEERRKREEEQQRREKEQREREEIERRKEKEREKEREKTRKMEKELAHINASTELILKHKKEEKPKSVRPQEEEEEEDEKIWICPTCHVAWTEGANMVACDQCNDWFHWNCVGLLVAPQEDTAWFCKKCSRKPMKRTFKLSGDTPKKKKKSTEGYGYVK